MQVGFVGTGVMGAAMVRCLIEADHQVTVYDRRREATDPLCALGARWADTPRAVAAASEVVCTSLPGPPEVEQVVFDETFGVLAGLQTGSAYIDLTTNAPPLARRLAEVCRARGIAMLDAPVSGRPPNMTIMVGGEADTFTTYQSLLACMGRRVIYVGEAGAGCTAKLVSQYLGYANLVTAAEGLLIGAKAGIDLEALAQIIPVSAGASRMFDVFPRTVFSGAFASDGSLDIVAKDLHLVCELAYDVQAPCRIGAIVDEVLQRGQAQGLGRYGFPNVVRVLEQMAGAQLRVPETLREGGDHDQ